MADAGMPTLAYARASYGREKHPDNADLTRSREEGFDRLIESIRFEERAKVAQEVREWTRDREVYEDIDLIWLIQFGEDRTKR
jgi:hypothetical protein